MKNIIDLVTERLHINKNTQADNRPVDINDPKNWVVGDILVGKYTYNKTNYSAGTKIVRFYKIISRTDTKLNLVELKKNILSGDRRNGECIPDKNTELEKDSVKIKDGWPIELDGFTLKYWNGEKVDYYKN